MVNFFYRIFSCFFPLYYPLYSFCLFNYYDINRCCSFSSIRAKRYITITIAIVGRAITINQTIKKRSKIPKMKQRWLIAIEKSPILLLLLQYQKKGQFDVIKNNFAFSVHKYNFHPLSKVCNVHCTYTYKLFAIT